MKRYQIAWYLWAVGSVLIVLSWFQVVSIAIGWCGFGIGMVGSVIGWGLRPPHGGPQAEPPKTENKHSDDVR